MISVRTDLALERHSRLQDRSPSLPGLDVTCRTEGDLEITDITVSSPEAVHALGKPEGTYMLFLDCTEWCQAHGKTIDDVEHACWDVGVALQDGRQFHGPCHLRINLALPLSRVEEAFRRLDQYVFNA